MENVLGVNRLPKIPLNVTFHSVPKTKSVYKHIMHIYMVYITHIFEFIYLYNSRSAELDWTKVMECLIKCMCTLCTRYICI